MWINLVANVNAINPKQIDLDQVSSVNAALNDTDSVSS